MFVIRLGLFDVKVVFGRRLSHEMRRPIVVIALTMMVALWSRVCPSPFPLIVHGRRRHTPTRCRRHDHLLVRNRPCREIRLRLLETLMKDRLILVRL